MPIASDNKFPKLIITEGSSPSNPDSGDQKLFIKSSDHKLYLRNSAGSETLITPTAATTVANDTIWDAKGDLAVATAADTAQKLTVGTNGTFLMADSAQISGMRWAALTGTGMITTIMFTIDGGGSAITTGIKGDIQMDFGCAINAATLLADQTGSIVLDLWKDIYANYPPTVSDTITASAKPTLSSATKSQDTTLTGWTVNVNAGDIIRVNVDSAATVTRVLLALKVTRA